MSRSGCSMTTPMRWVRSISASCSGSRPPGRTLDIRETHKLEGRFAAVAEVDALGDRLETWSRLCLDQLQARVAA